MDDRERRRAGLRELSRLSEEFGGYKVEQAPTCELCRGWGQFECLCDEPQPPHVHACGACAEGQRLAEAQGTIPDETPRIDRLMDEPSPFEIPPDRPLDVPLTVEELRKRVEDHDAQLAFYDTVLSALAEALRPFWGPR